MRNHLRTAMATVRSTRVGREPRRLRRATAILVAIGVVGGVAVLPAEAATTKPKATVSISDASVVEGTAPDPYVNPSVAVATFSITLSGSDGRAASVDVLSADGTALGTHGDDYRSVHTTVTWAAGEGDSTKTVDVAIIGDAIDENDETFSLVLRTAVGATIVDGSGQGTIVDDDDPPQLQFIGDSTGPLEGDTARWSISLDGSSERTVSFSYATASGTATSGVDFAPTSGHVSLSPTAPSAIISIPTLRDDAVEDSESFTVAISDVENARIIPVVLTGMIADRNFHPVLSAPYAGGQAGITEAPCAVWWPSVWFTDSASCSSADRNTGAMEARAFTAGTVRDAPATLHRSTAMLTAGQMVYTQPTKLTYRFVYALDGIDLAAPVGSAHSQVNARAIATCSTCTFTESTETLADSATATARASGTYTLTATIANGGKPLPAGLDVQPALTLTSDIVADTDLGPSPDPTCTGLNCMTLHEYYGGDGRVDVRLRLLRIEVEAS